MTNVRIIKHEAIPGCGSYEVRFSDGKPSRFFYWEDVPSRRIRDQMTSEQALELAKAIVRGEDIAGIGTDAREQH
jgi:hypothetical protein